MPEESAPLAVVTMTAGHAMLELASNFPNQEKVCLALVTNCPDDEDALRIDVNFEPAVITIEETATLLKVSQHTVRYLLRQGKLERLDIDDETRITWSSLVAFVESQARFPA